MYVDMYMYIYICLNTHMTVYTDGLRVTGGMQVYGGIIYIYLSFIYVYICMYMDIYIYVYVCMILHTNKCIYTYI
jgi:hypothetical protein